jgi:glucose/arabinose dehydrogenase
MIPGCGANNTSADARLTVVADGFNGPTQIADGPPGIVLVAQLNGDEGAATGQVIALDTASGQRRVLVSGLDKPTGVLWRNDELWVMVKRGLITARWAGTEPTAGAVEVVLADLPFNGRSQGTLTALPDGRFLYDTSGNLVGSTIEAGSGTLWAFDPVTRTSAAVATNAKHAYAHALLADGRVVTTEIGDAETPPVDEVNVIALDEAAPADLGWPSCPGDRSCDGVVRPLALFAPHATPTGVAVIGNTGLVTLFATDQLVQVPLDGWTAGAEPVPAKVVAEDLHGPHTVLARPDGSVWITEHLSGRIVSLRL